MTAAANSDLSDLRLEQKEEQLQDKRSTVNSRIFYSNIGNEPYRINQYVRPKGLATFKLVQNPREKDADFTKRL